MREILFRAKVIHNHFEKPDGTYRLPQGSWVYGCLIKDCNERPMIDIQGYVDGSGVHYQYYVDPETVGQFTGLHDKNGKEIYDGDVIKVKNLQGVVVFHPNGYYCLHTQSCNIEETSYTTLGDLVDYLHREQYEDGLIIIGNIHDNPELMKGGNQ